MLVVFIGAYPDLHNQYVHPLGRLSLDVSEGDSCASVRERFSQYAADHPSPELQFTEPTFTTDLLYTTSVVPSAGLYLRDVNVFDDLELSVRCDPQGRVAEVLFIGD